MRAFLASAALGAALGLGLGGCGTEGREAQSQPVTGEALAPIYREVVDFGIGNGALTDSGGVLVSAPSEGFVRVLNLRGDSVGTIGRTGDGPCEFRSVTDFVAVGSVAAAIAEARLGRMQVCEMAGGPGTTLLVPGQILAPSTAGPDSIIFAARIGADTIAVFRVNRRGATQGFVPVDTIAMWRTDTIGLRLGQPKGQIPILVVRRDGVLIVASSADSTFRILEFSPNGTITVVVDRSEAPILYTTGELQERQDWIQRTIRRSGRPVPPPLPLSEMRKVKPRFSWKSLGVDGAGVVWTRPASVQDTLVPVIAFQTGGNRSERRFLVAAPVRDITVAGRFLATFGEDSEGRGVIALYRISK